MADSIRKTTIKSGAYEVVLSEQILMDSLESELVIDLVIDKYPFGNMKIRFLQTENRELDIKSYIENKELTIECINFDAKREAGTMEPMSIGKVDGKLVKMMFWVEMLGNQHSARKITVTLYKEK